MFAVIFDIFQNSSGDLKVGPYGHSDLTGHCCYVCWVIFEKIFFTVFLKIRHLFLTVNVNFPLNFTIFYFMRDMAIGTCPITVRRNFCSSCILKILVFWPPGIYIFQKRGENIPFHAFSKVPCQWLGVHIIAIQGLRDRCRYVFALFSKKYFFPRRPKKFFQFSLGNFKFKNLCQISLGKYFYTGDRKIS